MIILISIWILLATITLIVFIHPRIHSLLKAALIPTTLWCGFIFLFIPQIFAGRPIEVKQLPDDCTIISYHIVEPSKKDKDGKMYFWVCRKKENRLNPFNPKKIFTEIQNFEPTSYQLKYNKELHKQLEKAARKQKKTNGSLKWKGPNKNNKKKKGGYHYKKEDKKGRFEVINPVKFMPPKN